LRLSGLALRLLSLAARALNSATAARGSAKLMPIYDQTPGDSFLRMLDPKNGLGPGDPERIAALIIERVDVEPAPLPLVLGSQPLEGALTTLCKRVAGFEAQTELAASRTFRPRRDIFRTFLPNTTNCRRK